MDKYRLFLNDETTFAYTVLKKLIGEHINYVRNKKQISLRELNRKTGISIAVLSDLENSKKIPRIDIVIKIAISLGIPLLEIFSEKLIKDSVSKDLLNSCRMKSSSEDIIKYSSDKNIKSSPYEYIKNVLAIRGFNKVQINNVIAFIEYTAMQNK